MLAPSLATAAALRLPLFPGAGHAAAVVAAAADRGRAPRRTPRAALVVLAVVVGLDALAGTPRTANRPLPPDSPPALGALLHGGRPPGARRDSLVAAAPAPLDAFLVTSARDCSTNLGVLDLLARETIAPRIRLAGALVVTPAPVPAHHRAGPAPPADTAAALRAVREAIAARGLPAAPTVVRALDAPTALLLRRIGYRETPFLVVVDSAGTLRFATPSPPTFADQHALAHTLTALAGASTARR